MLEVNNNHKSTDLSKIKNKSKRNKVKVIVAGILLSSILLLSGCKKTENVNENLDRVMITINDETYAFDITDYHRWSKSNTALYLTDGTTIQAHPLDIDLYNNKSDDMTRIEKIVCSNYVENDDIIIKTDEESEYNRAIVELGDGIAVLEISDITRWDDSQIELNLTDGTRILVNPMDVVLFNSASPIMKKIQTNILGDNKVLKK